MRVWDICPSVLSRQSLLGEHREIHAIWNVLIYSKRGYSRHPETLRWKNRLLALLERHNKVVQEMVIRGYNHKSDLYLPLCIELSYKKQDVFINSIEEQREILLRKYGWKDLGRNSLINYMET